MASSTFTISTPEWNKAATTIQDIAEYFDIVSPAFETANASLENTTSSDMGGGMLIKADLVDYYNYMSMDIRKYTAGWILIGGLGGNILNLLVLQSKYFRNNPSSVLLTALAVVDTAVLLNGLLRLWIKALSNDTYDIRNLSNIGCKVQIFNTYFLSHLSSWTLVLINIERFISVYFPFKAREVCSRKRLLVALLCIVAILIAANGHFFWTFHLIMDNTIQGGVAPRCTIVQKYKSFIGDVFYWIDFSLLSFGPFAVIVFCNCCIIAALLRRVSARKKMTSNQKLDDSATSITTMLVAISVVFIICTSPTAIFLLCLDIISKNTYDVGDYNQYVLYHWVIFDILTLTYYTNSAINFLMYAVSGKTFRKALIKLCQCGRVGDKSGLSTNASVTITSTVSSVS